MVALGLVNLALSLWRRDFTLSTGVLVGALLLLGVSSLLRSLSPQLSQQDKIEEQDERNILNLEADTCVLGKSMRHNMQLTRMATKSYEVDPDNPYLSVYDGALYSKDYKKIVAFPAEKTEVEFHKNLKVIGQDSFINAQIPVVVVPWGVTIIEDNAFSHMGSYGAAVILPDTLELAGTHDQNIEEWATVYLYSDKNTVAQQAYPVTDNGYRAVVEQTKEKIGFTSVYDYYPGVL